MKRFSGSRSLVEFAFESRLGPEVGSSLLSRLAGQVWRHNMAAGVTGEMQVSGREVRQVIEGEVDVVLPLASRILADRRHGEIRVVAFRTLAERRHRGWHVSGVDLPAAVEEPLPGATVVPFRPRLPAAQGEPAPAPQAGRRRRDLLGRAP